MWIFEKGVACYYSESLLIQSLMGKKFGRINGVVSLPEEGCNDKYTRNTLHIAFTVMFSLINNQDVDIAYSDWKKFLISLSTRNS